MTTQHVPLEQSVSRAEAALEVDVRVPEDDLAGRVRGVALRERGGDRRAEVVGGRRGLASGEEGGEGREGFPVTHA